MLSLVVLHHTPDGLEADRGPDVPGPAPALNTEHLPQPASLHLRGAPPVTPLTKLTRGTFCHCV